MTIFVNTTDPLAKFRRRAEVFKAPAVAQLPERDIDPTPPHIVKAFNPFQKNNFTSEQNNIHLYAEVSRIVKLPIVWPMDIGEYAEYNRINVQAVALAAGFRLFQRQAEVVSAYETYGGACGFIGVGDGKCVCGDTEIFDVEEGRRLVSTAGHLVTTTIIEGTGKLDYAQADSFSSGEKFCVRLTLKSGQSVGLSTDHPVLTHRGWVLADELLTDDLIATPRILPPSVIDAEVSDECVRAVAAFLSNGATTCGQANVCDEEGLLLDEFRKDVAFLGGTTTTVPEKSKAVNVKTKGLKPFLVLWELTETLSKNKRVPARFYLLPRRQVALFLNRFWAANGSVSRVKLECTLASEGLIKDLQQLLLRLGVLSRYSYKKATYVHRGERRWRDAWVLNVTGSPNIIRFFNEIGIPLGHDNASRQLLARATTIKTNTNTDVVPIGRKELSNIFEELGFPQRGKGRGGDGNRPRTDLRQRLSITGGQWLSRAAFASWVADSSYSGKYAWLADSDIAWERIKSVVQIGQQPVYDLSVPGTHNFIGNGIVLHNTLATLMIAGKAYAKGLRKILLLVPSAVLGQLVITDIPWARSKVGINYPIHVLGGRPGQQRKALAMSGRPGLYIFTYSGLSAKDSSELIHAIKPELIICDEAHNVGRASARTKRLFGDDGYVSRYHPEGVCLSGTMTAKSIKDYWQLIRWCLGNNNPLPNSSHVANDWATVLDAQAGESSGGGGTGPLMPLVKWAREKMPVKSHEITEDLAGFRKAFRWRMETAPGVVSSGDATIGTSLIIANRPVPDHKKTVGWKELETLQDKVNNEWLTPDNDEIEHSIHTWKWLYELSGGFYNKLTWPGPSALASRKGIDDHTALELLERAKEHHGAGQEYAKALRKWLQEESFEGCDTPMLVGNEFFRNGSKSIDNNLYLLWKDWKGLDFPDRPARDSSAVRICPYKVYEALKWVLEEVPKGEGALIWVFHQEMGQWMVDTLIETGVPNVLHCPAGNKANTDILDARNAKKIIVASMSSHGTGKNLQAFQHQYFLQWPRPAIMAEQTIGRTHRNGQMADQLVVYTNQTQDFDDLNFAACLNDSLYIHQTTGNRQKLIYATYDPMPKIFPAPVLRERGFQNKALNYEQQQLMKERFGK